MLKFLQLTGSIVLLTLCTTTTFAQVGDPAGDPDVPIDGGASLLVAAGVAFGAKKVNDRRKKRQQSAD